MSNAINAGTIDDVVAEATAARQLGAHTFWSSQIFGHDALTVLAVVGREVPGIELGTAVVPTYPRHPMMLAQQALSTQAAINSRGDAGLCLGIGLSHQIVVESMWGLSYAKPVRHLKEYLSVLMPLLEGKPVSFAGEEFRVNGGVSVPGSSRPSVLVAALGPQMLRVTGALADGTSTWCVGPKTLTELTIPTLRQAAADAGRPEPRIAVALPVCVTDDVAGARARAAQVFAVYDTLPSYKSMMNREGVDGPGGLAIVGTEAEVRDQIAELAAIGVTDFNAGVFTATHERYWTAAKARYGDKTGTQALVEALLLHRTYPRGQVLAGLEAALAVGALSPEAVAVEVRRAGETRPQLGLVTAEGRIAYPADTRPIPTVDAYDTLLTRGTPT